MTIDDTAYREAVDYLVRYGEDDWMMLSVVVSEADNVLGNSSTNAEIADMTMRLAAVLLDAHIAPGDLVADDRDFVPWPGSPGQQLERLRAELTAMVEEDRLPMGADICWFHTTTP